MSNTCADASTYSIGILTAKRIFETAHWLQSENPGGAWRKPAALLIKALANVVDCGNSEAKFKQLPLSNEKVRTGLWEVLAARQASFVVLERLTLLPTFAELASSARTTDRRPRHRSSLLLSRE